jgi:NSS family neurotransmitter:Na+ symporter
MASADTPAPSERQQWSRFGFVLAASGSAIGLGNIVFFPANAYRFGGGTFYVPYAVALVVVGIPLMILELALGQQQRKAYPQALAVVAGRRGEWVGWWALANCAVVTLYYVTILAWVVGMAVAALGALWEPVVATPGFTSSTMPNPAGTFYRLVSGPWPVVFVLLVWAANAWILRRGTTSIERAVKLFVPAMWGLMAVLLVRGLTLPGGAQGVLCLFTPDLAALADPAVWQGAFSQIFFTLSVGFGVLTAYGSYLPRESDQVNNALVVSLLNCGFEYVAGAAIFAILFAVSAVPQASTVAMMFFVVPRGIAQLPGGPVVVALFGVLFFVLLLMAGLSSSVSMIEGIVSALLDRMAISRRRAVVVVCSAGAAAGSLFALPFVVDPGAVNNGTLGLTLLDLVDHWAFGYGLLAVGLSQCLLIGWGHGSQRLRRGINASSGWRLGRWFDVLVRWVAPAVVAAILLASIGQEVAAGLYGAGYAESYAPGWAWLAVLPPLVLLLWLVVPARVASRLSRLRPGGRALVAFLLLGAGGSVASAVGLSVEAPGGLTVGRPTVVRWVAEGASAPVRITAVYHPRSRVQREEPLGELAPGGGLAWRPARAGLVTLTAAGATEDLPEPIDLSVRYRRPPRSGIAVLALAGCLLFGGAAVALHRHWGQDV